MQIVFFVILYPFLTHEITVQIYMQYKMTITLKYSRNITAKFLLLLCHTLLFSGSYFNSKKWSYKKRYRITPFLELKVTPLVALKCNTTFGAILTPFSGVKI